ncbi:type II CRISPR RNA-guided endonuclease Cas9 [Chryseobacterium sp. CBo1]|uniref:type II CRISPR RNA-guided endonuclease Cas9 n=1 Tax=Chryseobacterium sp. CBo1 TaxID=1869230 RepID=UPI00081057D3|nr:type II CRISPR RNA-guided endonuclease Cas9 [Chryseobacterium sp. CBo1]OCK49528.1 type II CRISPR RNA-guided endonuclease Cas9 [Chryseobacterium sp. CBo1]
MTKNILGLDLGTNSIGWALIEVDENNTPIRIIAMGSRIIPLSTSDKEEFQRGLSITKNQSRTVSRTQRKGYDRKQLKKSDLKKILNKYNIFPSEELLKLPMLDLWKLRSDSANPNENISAEQLGRILYMLNQKRGYKSARSEANADKKDTDYVQAVKGRYAQLKERNQTIGQYFYEELYNANTNNSYFRIKEEVYPREAYTEEFDTIINAQKNKHDFLTDEVVHQLRNEIIYFQRKLKSQKGLVSICEFEGFEKTVFDKEKNKDKVVFVGSKVAPKTSPLFQLCRIWEVVNTISLKIKNPEGSKYKWGEKTPNLKEKEILADYLFKNDSLSFTKLLEILDLNKNDVYVNKQILKGIKGNETFSALHTVLGDNELLNFDVSIIPSNHTSMLVDKKTGEILEERAGLELDASLEKEPLYQLWHTIYSLKVLDECKNALIKRFGFDDETAEKLSHIDFNKQAFGNKSNKSMRKILPFLMEGYDYSQSCSLAGYNHSNSLTKDEREQQITLDRLELLSKNSLRQPIVEKILNQMINVVNAILEQYGKLSEIRVELARELKQSKDERNDADLQNSKNKKLNEEIGKRLAELGLPVTKRYIQKYKFIFPSLSKNLKDAHVNNQCIYCGETFNLTEALSGDAFDVDHIVPKALLFDDSQTNKVLVHRKCNSTKTNQTAYDYIGTKGEEQVRIYSERVDDWFKRGIISYSKMQRLKVSHKEYLERKKLGKETETDKKLWENFIDRQLRDTQYISRKAREILQKVCNNVTTTEGGITAKLRNLWGWDDVLMNLQMPKYKELGQTVIKEWTSEHGKRKHQKEEIENWTKRDDHRHHAIDALVVACTKQGFIQRINTLNSSDTKDLMQREIKEAKKLLGENYNEKEFENDNEFVKNHKERLSQLDDYLRLQKPVKFDTKYVEQEADKVLVSFKAGKKVATITKFKATGKNKDTGVIVLRGALHEQSVYGKIKVIEKDKPLKYLFENSKKIVNPKIKVLVEERLAENENNSKLSLSTLKKNPIFLNEEKTEILEKASCYNDATVLKYKLQSLKASQADDIVDDRVKFLVKERLAQFGNKEKEAFKDTLWLNEEKQIPIITVRLFARPDANNLQAIKKDKNGRDIGFVLTGNNHHIAIYEDKDNKLVQHSCTFWHAVERKKNNVPAVIKNSSDVWNQLLDKELPESFLNKLPIDKLKLKFSLQQNEMFVLGLLQEDFEAAIENNDKTLLSKHLYLVWSITDGDYFFRHHLETKNTELKKTEGAKESKRYFRLSTKGLIDLNPVKVRLNHLGEITKIGEY